MAKLNDPEKVKSSHNKEDLAGLNNPDPKQSKKKNIQ